MPLTDHSLRRHHGLDLIAVGGSESLVPGPVDHRCPARALFRKTPPITDLLFLQFRPMLGSRVMAAARESNSGVSPWRMGSTKQKNEIMRGRSFRKLFSLWARIGYASGVSVEVYTLSATLLRGLVSNGFSASGW